MPAGSISVKATHLSSPTALVSFSCRSMPPTAVSRRRERRGDFRVVLEMLESGDVTLTTVCLLAPHLTADNHQRVLNVLQTSEQARRRADRCEPASTTCGADSDSETTAERICDQETRETRLWSLRLTALDFTPVADCTLQFRRNRPVAKMSPLAPELYKLQVTLRRSTHEKLRRVQDLLRHTLPDGDVAAILDRALTVLLSDLERSKAGRTERSTAAA